MVLRDGERVALTVLLEGGRGLRGAGWFQTADSERLRLSIGFVGVRSEKPGTE